MLNSDRFRAWIGGTVLALACALWGAAAIADVLIVSSDVATLKPGQHVGAADRIEIPAGSKVRVLLPTGKTQLITGPASGAVKDIAKGGPIIEGVWAKAKDLIATGGADASRPGATRGAMVSVGPVAFAWNVVPANAGGNVCVEQGAQLKLARAAGDKAAEATLFDTSANAKSPIAWPAQTLLADWPPAVSPRSDAVYQVITASARPVLFTLRVVDKSNTDEDSTLAALLEKGCHAQARAWLAR